MNINDLSGEELFSHLRKNANDLILAKKASFKYCDAVVSVPIVHQTKSHTKIKADDGTSEEPQRDTIDVTIVANVANFVDSHMDMLLDDAYTESITKRGTSIPHLLDHIQSAVGHIGDVTKVYTKQMELKDLGLNRSGSTTALIMESTVKKAYNAKTFDFYSADKINQHSIGLSYGDIQLAINSKHEDDKEAKALWDKHYPQVINKELVDKKSYFWLVNEVDVLENSAVLFGSNHLTPTLSIASQTQEYNKILSLGNDTTNVINQPSIGILMTLEEAQGKIISLTEELAAAKAAIPLAEAGARLKEKQRTTDILKAQATFGNEEALKKAAYDFIENDSDTKTALVAFEVIKASLQAASHLDTTNTQQSTLTPGKVKSLSEVMMGIATANVDKPDFGDLL